MSIKLVPVHVILYLFHFNGGALNERPDAKDAKEHVLALKVDLLEWCLLVREWWSHQVGLCYMLIK